VKKFKFNAVVTAALVAILFGSCKLENEKSKPNMPTFLDALNEHLKAIKQRNIKALEPTVAENVTVIDPNGIKSDGKKEFLHFHANWFAQSNWERNDTILTTSVSDSIGYTLIQYQYIQNDTLGNIEIELHAYQILIFENSYAGWQLIFDQNTAIQHLNRKINN
jgi:ketosteroid isomerase-like protein